MTDSDSTPPPAARHPEPPEAFREAAHARHWMRRTETVVVITLGLASLLAAWAGYEAGNWSSMKAAHVVTAETKLIEGTRLTLSGSQSRQVDLNLFTNWLNAAKTNQPELAAFYAQRFPPRLKTAFDAWQRTDPLTNPAAPGSPFDMPEYQVPDLLAAVQADEDAQTAFALGESADKNSDAFVQTTILLAVVLFIGGISTRLSWLPAQLAMVGLAAVLLVFCIVRIGQLPDGSGAGWTPLW